MTIGTGAYENDSGRLQSASLRSRSRPRKRISSKNPFKDVSESDWFYDSVLSAYANGLMSGVSDTEFAPYTNITRGMFVTVLYRMESEPETALDYTFADMAAMLFELEKVTGLKFDIDVKRPPRDDNRECSLKFEGKAKTDLNADMCLFLEDWANARENYETEKYDEWKDKTLAYYSRLSASAKPQTEDNAVTVKAPNVEF